MCFFYTSGMSFLISLGKNLNYCCAGALNIIRATGPTPPLSAIAYICVDYAAESFLRQRKTKR